jgi:hypothetical protein
MSRGAATLRPACDGHANISVPVLFFLFHLLVVADTHVGLNLADAVDLLCSTILFLVFFQLCTYIYTHVFSS